MTILFLTMSDITDINIHGVYQDLMCKFRDCGHNVFIVSPCQRRYGKATELMNVDGVHILRVRTLNVQKANVVEKGIGQISIEFLYKRAIKKYLREVGFDLILYSTPPITFPNVIEYVKRRNPMAKTYLMLKDIFPQNALDLGMLSDKGLKGGIYRLFKKKEKKLYDLSDHIGCMSPANVDYLLKHNSYIEKEKVEICPNSYAPTSEMILTEREKEEIRKKHSLPTDKPIFIFGGNLGKPQGIPFVIKCLDASAGRKDCHFVLIGDGTEYPKLDSWVSKTKPSNVSLFRRLPKSDYDKLTSACDIGLIFLDYKFTIPNYPSRLLPYLMNRKPIFAVTDRSSDIGQIAEVNGYGLWCPSNDVDAFEATVSKILDCDLSLMGEKGYEYYLNNYTVQHTYDAIIQHF